VRTEHILRDDDMQRRLIILVMCLAVLTLIFVAAWKTYIRLAPARATNAYVHALVSGDKAGALASSSGSAAFNAKRATLGIGIMGVD
jgi:hypothetical protein